jgi:hypothetical protein
MSQHSAPSTCFALTCSIRFCLSRVRGDDGTRFIHRKSCSRRCTTNTPTKARRDVDTNCIRRGTNALNTVHKVLQRLYWRLVLRRAQLFNPLTRSLYPRLPRLAPPYTVAQDAANQLHQYVDWIHYAPTPGSSLIHHLCRSVPDSSPIITYSPAGAWGDSDAAQEKYTNGTFHFTQQPVSTVAIVNASLRKCDREGGSVLLTGMLFTRVHPSSSSSTALVFRCMVL